MMIKSPKPWGLGQRRAHLSQRVCMLDHLLGEADALRWMNF
jgi:hypothetical protein